MEPGPTKESYRVAPEKGFIHSDNGSVGELGGLGEHEDENTFDNLQDLYDAPVGGIV